MRERGEALREGEERDAQRYLMGTASSRCRT